MKRHSTTAETILTEKNLKKTKRRIAIFTIFKNACSPIDATYIKKKLKKMHLITDEVTVYRTIKTFLRAHIIKEIRFRDNRVRYELVSTGHHHHIVCTVCGKAERVAIKNCNILKTIEQHIERDQHFTDVTHSLEFFGVHTSCKKH